MYEDSYTSYHTQSDKALAEHIGKFIKHHRVQKGLTQQEVSEQANISRSTLSLLERGESVTLTTLLQVMRVLDILHVLDAFKVFKTISPLLMAKEQEAERKRVRKSNTNTNPPSEW